MEERLVVFVELDRAYGDLREYWFQGWRELALDLPRLPGNFGLELVDCGLQLWVERVLVTGLTPGIVNFPMRTTNDIDNFAFLAALDNGKIPRLSLGARCVIIFGCESDRGVSSSSERVVCAISERIGGFLRFGLPGSSV